jgi:hypothetical protein
LTENDSDEERSQNRRVEVRIIKIWLFHVEHRQIY